MDESRKKKIKMRKNLMIGAIIALGVLLLSLFAVFYIRARSSQSTEPEASDESSEDIDWQTWLEEVEKLRAEAEGN